MPVMSFHEEMRDSQKKLRDKRNMTDMRGMFGDSTGKKSGRGDKKSRGTRGRRNRSDMNDQINI